MTNIVPANVTAHAVHSIFGSPLVDNRFRPLLVEAMIDLAIGDDWRWCAHNWAGHDFEHRSNGTKLEVKQSARRQSWHSASDKSSELSFGIEPSKGYYVGNKWTAHEVAKRIADIYVFAAHEIENETADHRDPTQWRFHIVRTRDLPNTQRVTLPTLLQIASRISANISELEGAVRKICEPVIPGRA